MPENIGKIRVYPATVINSVEISARQDVYSSILTFAMRHDQVDDQLISRFPLKQFKLNCYKV